MKIDEYMSLIIRKFENRMLFEDKDLLYQYGQEDNQHWYDRIPQDDIRHQEESYVRHFRNENRFVGKCQLNYLIPAEKYHNQFEGLLNVYT